MSEGHRIIPISPDAFRRREVPVVNEQQPSIDDSAPLADRRGRPLRDLRISVIDQCNFRCGYCMPKEVFHKDYVFLSRDELLSFAEITRLARVFVGLGVEKLRITGGEPLLRKGLEELIADLAILKTINGQPVEIALTTNGVLLAQKAQALRDAGLNRVTVSLDALDPERFRQMAGLTDSSPEQVLAGIAAAEAAGLRVKVNTVIQKGVNHAEILPIAEKFREMGPTVRFIEFMDVGNSNDWHADQVVPSQEVIARISQSFPLVPVGRATPNEVSERWRYRDLPHVEVGVISSISKPFCGECSRARISSEGLLYTCLFASSGFDLRQAVRAQPDDAALSQMIQKIWRQREDRYSELRDALLREKQNLPQARAKVEMSYIGG
ncbi:MAG: GTP 3',8-cyclase MoaA [Burkholderiaceae bacterium]